MYCFTDRILIHTLFHCDGILMYILFYWLIHTLFCCDGILIHAFFHWEVRWNICVLFYWLICALFCSDEILIHALFYWLIHAWFHCNEILIPALFHCAHCGQYYPLQGAKCKWGGGTVEDGEDVVVLVSCLLCQM